MRLESFSALGLNRDRVINIEFGAELTFLTGVNGSGKTSVLASILALLTPNLEALATLNYDKIEVTCLIGAKRVSVVAHRDNGVVSLRVKGRKEPFRFPIFEDGLFGPDVNEARSRYYTELLGNALNKNPVLSDIENIPTPMFLGLDRRYRGSTSATSLAGATNGTPPEAKRIWLFARG